MKINENLGSRDWDPLGSWDLLVTLGVVTPEGVFRLSDHSKGPQASKLQASNLHFSVLRAASQEHRVIESSSHRVLELGGRGGSL